MLERGSESGLECITLQDSTGQSTKIFLQGATVTSWSIPQLGELLFTSSEVVFSEGKAIRGGVPIIFPQFSNYGSLPAHGFARSARWKLQETKESPAELGVTFLLHETADTLKLWNFPFELQYSVSLKHGTKGRPALEMVLAAKNTGSDSSCSFTTALHSYFSV